MSLSCRADIERRSYQCSRRRAGSGQARMRSVAIKCRTRSALSRQPRWGRPEFPELRHGKVVQLVAAELRAAVAHGVDADHLVRRIVGREQVPAHRARARRTLEPRNDATGVRTTNEGRCPQACALPSTRCSAAGPPRSNPRAGSPQITTASGPLESAGASRRAPVIVEWWFLSLSAGRSSDPSSHHRANAVPPPCGVPQPTNSPTSRQQQLRQ